MEREILTILISASPVSELRGAIPVAVFLWDFSFGKAYLLSVFGNFLPVIPLLLFWKHLSERLSRHVYFLNRFFSRLFKRTKERHNHHFEFWKELGLIVFVAIPLPFTGAWSGTVAAFVFGIPFRRAVLDIGIGILIAGLIMLTLLKAGTML